MSFDNSYTAAPGNEIGRRRQQQVRSTNTPQQQQKKKKIKREGIYTMTQVYCNGTIRMQRDSI